MKKISIILAVYNGAETIENCIESILEQTYPNKELIIIDGGSNDGTVDVLNTHNDSIAYWESKKDKGIYHAWNKALKHAEGDYICFMGADDTFLDQHALSMLMSEAKHHNYPDLVLSKAKMIDERGQCVGVEGIPLQWDRVKKWMGVTHTGMLHHKNLFERFGEFDQNYKIAADYDFLLRMENKVTSHFVDSVSVLKGNTGVSRKQVIAVLIETKHIQSQHPGIGKLKANYNFSIALIKAGYRFVFR